MMLAFKLKKMAFILPILFFLFALNAVAEEKKILLETPRQNSFPDIIFSASEAEKSAMDIHPSRFADFWKKWHFVSVRWRQDVREFRFTYANDLAWKTMSEHRTDYPVGAMFGKLVYPAEDDLALPSSVLSSNDLSRLMVMLWDPKHKKVSSDGWVYLRYTNPDFLSTYDKDSTGKLGVMSQKQIDSCVECHARASDRGFVFSQPMFLFQDEQHKKSTREKVSKNRFEDSMKQMALTDVPRIAVNLIESLPEWKGRKVFGYEGSFFMGALGEMGPVLTRMALKDTNAIYIIYDRDDPNTIELVSSIKKTGYENCAGLIQLRGSGAGKQNEVLDDNGKKFPEMANDSSIQIKEQGAIVNDLTKLYKPQARLYITCDSNAISRQILPLLYTVKDSDGLPNYYFAPAILD